MRKIFILATLACLFAIPAKADRGDIISYEKFRDWNPQEAAENYWAIIAGNIPETQRDSFQPVFYNIMEQLMVGKRIVSYRVIYKTIDHYGNPTQASGLVLFPVHDGKSCDMPIFYYGHGTRFERYSGPSRPDRFGNEAFFVYMAAAFNFIGVAPDYYGMGDGPGFHHHNSAQTNSTSGIDMIRAARNLARMEGVGYNSQLYVSGYSEGGHNAMGILKMIYDQHLQSEFNVVSAGCGSGAYDEYDLQYHFIVDNPYYPTRSYILYIIATCQDIYHNLIGPGETVSDYLKHPYDSLYNAHLLTQDGDMDWVPLPWTDLFQPGKIETVTSNPNHPLRQCLKQSNLYDWPNPFITNLYYVTSDQQVYWRNAPKAKLAQWKYIPWYRFWDKARIATHDMTNKGQVQSHEEGAIPIMLHYMITANSSKIMSCTDSVGRASQPLPGGLSLNFDKSIDIPVSSFPGLSDVNSYSFAGFHAEPLSFKYDAANYSYHIQFEDVQPGAYMLRLTNSSGGTYFIGLTYDEPNFLEDENYDPISQGSDGSYLLDMTLLQDQVGKILLYTSDGKWIKTIEDPYAVQQLAIQGELPTGNYVVEVQGRQMRYYLKMNTAAMTSKASIKIFPNPFSNNLTIEEKGNNTLLSVTIFSAEGKACLLNQSLNGQHCEINTASLPAGIYLLQITDSEGTRTEKVTKF